MGRTKRSAKLETRTARLTLEVGVRHVDPIQKGRYLIYQRPMNRAAGAWLARWYDLVTKKQRQVRLGAADDYLDADGKETLTFSQAQEKAREWFKSADKEALAKLDGDAPQEGPLTVEQALKVYFADANRRGVKGLGRDERRAAVWILPELGALDVQRLTRHRIETWMATMAESARRIRSPKPAAPDAHVPKPRNFKVPRAPKATPAPPTPPATDDEKRARRDSANRVLTILKAALNHALDRRLVTSGEAWREVKPYRGTTKARVRFLTPEDQVRVVNACPADFRRLVQGALVTGGRYGELTQAQVQDFDPTSGTLFLVGKGTGQGKPRRVVLTEEGQALFQTFTTGRPQSELIFQRGEVKRRKHLDRGLAWGHSEQGRLMEAACKAASLAPVTFHELRHTYASMLVNAGCPLAYVAAQLGHSDTRMVEKHYGHLAPTALAEAVRTLMPKVGLANLPNVAPLKIAGAK